MNQNIKKILFPTDFSDTAQNAFRYCLTLADRYHASIQLLHVIYPEYAAADLPVMASKATENKASAAREVMKTFVDHGLTQVQLARSFEQMPMIEADVEVGSPLSVIIHVAERDEVDLIVMGTRGEHGLLEKAFGSTSTGVIARAPCHVLVVPEEAPYESIDIVAYATDLSEADPYHIWKVGQMLEPFHPIFHCVHIAAGKEDQEVDMKELEAFFSNNAPALQINFHNVKGESVTEKLEEFVETYDVDVMVMFAPYRDLLDRIFRRSQTRRMALETHVPLLVIREE